MLPVTALAASAEARAVSAPARDAWTWLLMPDAKVTPAAVYACSMAVVKPASGAPAAANSVAMNCPRPLMRALGQSRVMGERTISKRFPVATDA